MPVAIGEDLFKNAVFQTFTQFTGLQITLNQQIIEQIHITFFTCYYALSGDKSPCTEEGPEATERFFTLRWISCKRLLQVDLIVVRGPAMGFRCIQTPDDAIGYHSPIHLTRIQQHHDGTRIFIGRLAITLLILAIEIAPPGRRNTALPLPPVPPHKLLKEMEELITKNERF